MTAARRGSLQDRFLNDIRRAHLPVTVFLMKGVKLQGHVTWFDSFSLLLKRDGQAQLIYKHAISTIVPSGPLEDSVELPSIDRAKASLQDIFLHAAAEQREAMTVFLANGVMLKGRIIGFDTFVLLLERDGISQMVYKHAVSTLQPNAALDLGGNEGEAN